MYANCNNVIIPASWSLVILIPSSHFAGPRSFNMNLHPISVLYCWINIFELPAIVQLSMWWYVSSHVQVEHCQVTCTLGESNFLQHLIHSLIPVSASLLETIKGFLQSYTVFCWICFLKFLRLFHVDPLISIKHAI